MLDALKRDNKQTNIDWVHVQRALNNFLSKFLNIWILLLLFLTPLMVVSYGYSSSTIQMIVVSIMVVIGWIAWFMRALVARERIDWKRFKGGWVLAILFIAILAVSLFRGINSLDLVNSTGPFAWLISILLVVLLLQELAGNKGRIRSAIISIISGVSVLGILILVFFILRLPEFVVPLLSGGSYLIQAGMFAIFFAMLAIVRTLTTGVRKKIILGIGMLFLAVAGISVADFVLSSPQTIPTTTSWIRLLDHGIQQYAILGAGLSQGFTAFWELAELVDFRESINLPGFSNTYVTLLWDGGFVLLLAFVTSTWSIVISALARSKSALHKLSSNAVERSLYTIMRNLGLSLGAWLIFLWFVPFSFLVLYITAILLVFVILTMYQEQASDPRQTRTWRIQGKHALQATRILLLALFILTIFGIVRISNLLNARLLVVSSVQRGELESLIINTDKLKKAINIAPYNNDHRILRISLIADVLEQPNPEPTPEQSQLYVEQLKLLDQDYVILSEALNSNELNGIQLWQIGSYAQRIGNLLFIPRELRAINRVSFLDYNLWHAKAAQFYEPALLKLPRNVVMQASIAQFYFLVGDRIEDTEENKPQKAGWYLRSKKLTDKSLAIDDTYGLALIGQAALLIRDEKQEQALGLIIPYVNSDVNLAYQAATISLELGKLEEAVNYYNIVLEQNPKHLQARFELTQALFALSRNKDAHAQLDELKALVPIDDFSTHEIIQELRESVE